MEVGDECDPGTLRYPDSDGGTGLSQAVEEKAPACRHTPRISPLPQQEWGPAITAMISLVGPLNVVRTLGRHPALCRHWFGLGATLLFRGTLPAHHRELAILRTAHLNACPYEQVHHVRAGREAGLSEAHIDAVTAEADEFAWRPEESAVLAAVDELHSTGSISEGTWGMLSRQHDERQIIELVMLVGYYRMTAHAINALRIPLEDWAMCSPPADQESADSSENNYTS
ncbi:carboxymuconolactone decarboxylase family protein [Streptomyces sp. NPDC007205]|uniref:carboxymuconolactone decarboxylase family protein n=1 Tax=Streptomyces sp. NPDC007205 TaxID=3154316 RepID=UPI0033EA94F4